MSVWSLVGLVVLLLAYAAIVILHARDNARRFRRRMWEITQFHFCPSSEEQEREAEIARREARARRN